MPPIDVYRIGDMHFVRDGHHRVSVARQLGLDVIEANVTEIETEVGADADVRIRDLAMKSHERLFFERVPLPPEQRSRIALPHGSWYAGLAEGVEAWGFRVMQACGGVHDARGDRPCVVRARNSSRSSRCFARPT